MIIIIFIYLNLCKIWVFHVVLNNNEITVFYNIYHQSPGLSWRCFVVMAPAQWQWDLTFAEKWRLYLNFSNMQTSMDNNLKVDKLQLDWIIFLKGPFWNCRNSNVWRYVNMFTETVEQHNDLETVKTDFMNGYCWLKMYFYI